MPATLFLMESYHFTGTRGAFGVPAPRASPPDLRLTLRAFTLDERCGPRARLPDLFSRRFADLLIPDQTASPLSSSTCEPSDSSATTSATTSA